MPTRAVIQRRFPTCDDLVAVHADLRALVERQRGVATRDQLLALGIGSRQIDAADAARRWRAYGRHVIVLHNGPLSASQREWVAVLLPDKPVALAGPSAVAAAGMTGFEPDRVHIVLAHDTHTRVPSWIKVHESRRFTRSDIMITAGPPRTRPTRSVVDAATWSRQPRRACAFLCAAVQQRLVTAEQLDAELRNAGAIRHIAIMRAIVGDIGGGGHTLAEIELAPLGVRAGLGPPRRQVLRREADGRTRYVDAEFDLPDGTRLVVEIDGAVHLRPEPWWDDQDRQNEVVIGGSPVLRWSSLTVRLAPARVVDQLSRMRVAHGG